MEQTNTTTENNESSSSSNNINIPQLTDARKQEIRKKLLERQRQARLQNSNRNAVSTSIESPSSSSGASSSNSFNNTTATTNNTNTNTTSDTKSNSEEDDTPPNQEMIKKAVTFLTSPKVQNAPTARKHSFLLSKGCTKKEIELAEKEIKEKGLLSNNDSSSTAEEPSYNTITTTVSQSQTPPPLPPRTYQNIQIVYRNSPLTRFQKVKRGLFIILFGASIIKGISIVVKNEIMRPLRELYKQYTQYLKSRNSVLNKYMLQVIEYCALFINDKNKDKVKRIKTIEEIEKGKEKAITEKKEGEEEEKDKTEEDESIIDNKKESDNDSLSEEKVKIPKERKAIKLKIHRKKKEKEEEEESSIEEKQLVEKEAGSAESTVRTLPEAVQEYIDETNTFHIKCKDAIDTYAYDLERNSDLFSGSLGQTMKLSSEVYQMVSREMYYNSSSSSSFYLDPYQFSGSDGDNVSLYARVNNIKSDIRRLKGMLLNHRNFPKYKQRALANAASTSSSS